MITALIFIAVLFVLILVHEWGHFIVAKLTRMRVDEFAIGFPPRLYSIRRGETEYSLNATMIGGYVRIHGEDPTQVDAGPDADRSFSARPKWAQVLVLIAGVSMNIVLAWFLFVIVFSLGVPTLVDPEAAGPDAEFRVLSIVPESELADQLPLNATIVSVTSGDQELAELNPAALSEFVQTAPNDITISYLVGTQEQRTVTVTPATGVLSDDPDRMAIGLSTGLVETRYYGPIEAIVGATEQTIQSLQLIVVSIARLLYNATTGEADFTQVAGPIGIFNLVGDAAATGIAPLLMFTAVISLNLAVINLFPFPALDGGRLVFVAIEAITRRPIDPIWAARLNGIGFLLLIALMIAVTYNDILRLI